MNTYSVTVYLDPWDVLLKSFKEKELFEQIWDNMSDDTFDEICEELAAAIGPGMSKEYVDFSEDDLNRYGEIEDDSPNIGSFRYDLSDEEFLAIDVNFTIDVDSYVEDNVK